jgi:protein-S-isoprenylcysteine O-methyltransferase Ste14
MADHTLRAIAKRRQGGSIVSGSLLIVARDTAKWILFSTFRYFGLTAKIDSCGRASIAQSRQTCFNEHVIRKVAAIVGSAVFLVIAPGFVAGLVPWWISHWHIQTAFLGLQALRFAGGILIALGTAGLLDSFLRFAVQGLGTPAPVFPTRHLVVTGLYRYVRNPIYVAVVSTILGQALIFGNVSLLEYGGLVWLFFHLFVLVYEEPTLRASFGPEYQVFCKEVPRWIPRLTPWDGHLNVPPAAHK